jgi:hypothetical protein
MIRSDRPSSAQRGQYRRTRSCRHLCALLHRHQHWNRPEVRPFEILIRYLHVEEPPVRIGVVEVDPLVRDSSSKRCARKARAGLTVGRSQNAVANTIPDCG